MVLNAGTGESKGLEEVGQVREGDEAGVIGQSGNPGEEGTVGAEGDRDTGLCRREVDGQVGLGADLGLPGKGRQGSGLKREAAED